MRELLFVGFKRDLTHLPGPPPPSLVFVLSVVMAHVAQLAIVLATQVADSLADLPRCCY